MLSSATEADNILAKDVFLSSTFMSHMVRILQISPDIDTTPPTSLLKKHLIKKLTFCGFLFNVDTLENWLFL